MSTTSWFRINVRDGLVLRDGRPNAGRSESQTLDFPNPGTIAGAARTALGRPDGKAFDPNAVSAVLKAGVRGPLLSSGNSPEPRLYVRRPADALFLTDEGGTARVRALHPLDNEDTTDLGQSLDALQPGLKLVGLNEDEIVAGKVSPHLPMFWGWAGMQRWLSHPIAERSSRPEPYGDDSIQSLPRDQRVNVAIDGDTYTTSDGMLFETTALKFQRQTSGVFPEDLGLLVEVATAEVSKPWNTLSSGVRPLGGERRLVTWEPIAANPLPPIPEAVTTAASSGADTVMVRLILLTPAWFERGALPSYILERRHNVTPQLVGALVGRPETISGWDFAKGKPKPSRRLVSAGSVYWLTLQGSPADRKHWVENTWMTNISDGEQERKDGFGFVVVGVGP